MLSVTDKFGLLERKRLQGYLFRAFGPLETETKVSGAGIGLSMSFRNVHQLIFNVHQGKRTEAIAGWDLRIKTVSEFRRLNKSLNLFWLPASLDEGGEAATG
jgi:hypothetical protein